MEVKQINSMAQVDCTDLNRLAGNAYPFLRHEFLLALEQSGSVCEQTGWEPAHLLVMDEDELIAFITKTIAEKSVLNTNAVMGLVMKEYRGKYSGQKILELIKKFKGE